MKVFVKAAPIGSDAVNVLDCANMFDSANVFNSENVFENIFDSVNVLDSVNVSVGIERHPSIAVPLETFKSPMYRFGMFPTP